MKSTPLSRPHFIIPLAQYCFEVSWALLARWTPKPFNPLRLLLLRLFGAKVAWGAFVHSRARVTHPWNVTLHSQSCLGDRAHAYALGRIVLGHRATLAQEAYLCTGTHDLQDPALPLITAPIVVGDNAFLGARAFVMPGVTIGANAIVGACSVVTRDVPPSITVAGNPARALE